MGLAGAECWFLVPMEGKSCLENFTGGVDKA